MKEDLKRYYAYLFEPELLEEIQQIGVYKEVKQGETLIGIGDYIKSMPLVLNGAIKIMRQDEQADELILYFLERGDTCAMTLACCLGQTKSEIIAVAETDVELLMIPVEKMSAWMSKYKTWQNFILQSYHARLMELLEAVDTIAFMQLDERLYKYLRDKAMVNRSEVIHATHQNIAKDLHTSRVVISRLLKRLEIEGKIILQRNQIEILDL